MINCMCIQKIRNKYNVIEGYILQDSNGNTITVTPIQLKEAIADNKVNVVNLQLTKSGRLLDKSTQNRIASYNIMGKNDLETNKKAEVKARLLGVAPELDANGRVVETSNSQLTLFTDSTSVINKNGRIGKPDKDIKFDGNKELTSVYNCIIVANKAYISNPAAMVLLSDNRLSLVAKDIIIDHNLIDIKILDEIFKILKTANERYTFAGALHSITFNTDKLSKDEIFDRCDKILKRQKPSSKTDRRVFDILIYFWFLYCISLSTDNDNRYKELANQYTEEYNRKRNLIGYGNYASFIIDKEKQLKEDLQDTLMIQI